MTTTTEVKGKGWWAIPEEKQKQILAAMPEQDEWTFIATRISDEAWSIDVPAADTYGELLVGGTEAALDEHYRLMEDREPENGDMFEVTVSTKPLDEQTTVFSKIKDDTAWQGSAFYRDELLEQECWLCPFTVVLWGTSPDTIYINLR